MCNFVGVFSAEAKPMHKSLRDLAARNLGLVLCQIRRANVLLEAADEIEKDTFLSYAKALTSLKSFHESLFDSIVECDHEALRLAVVQLATLGNIVEPAFLAIATTYPSSGRLVLLDSHFELYFELEKLADLLYSTAQVPSSAAPQAVHGEATSGG